MTNARDALNAAQARQHRQVDAAYRPLATAVAEAIRRHATPTPDGPRITNQSYLAIMAETDRALDAIFGLYNGDTRAPLYRQIVASAADAEAGPVAEAVATIRRALVGDAELLAMIEGAARVDR